MAVESEETARAYFDPGEHAEFGLPDLGRTVRVVGKVVNVDPEETPHPKVRRGEVGKALFNYARNTVAVDPLGRTNSPNRSRDQRNYFTAVLRQAPDGKVNPKRTEVNDPAAMARHIRRVGQYLGADIVGIGKAHPALLYGGGSLNDGGYTVDRSNGAVSPQELCERYPYVIVTSVAWDYALAQAHRHHIGDAAYDTTLMQTILVLTALERYIKDLGYTALRGKVNPQAAALASGVGELGRNGLIITQQFGARVHLNDAILTDLPLEPGKPIDLGVEDFCKICRKCAETCPTNSITFEGKQVFNGVEKYKIKWETCYKLRPIVSEHWNVCLTCSTVCPYTKPNAWWRTLALRTLTTTPRRLRPAVVRSLKWLDDTLWGRTANKRV